jgi:Flp pilus assembly pilin Flp
MGSGRGRTKSKADWANFARDQNGAIMVEYLVVLATVIIGFSISVVALGPSLIADYERSQAVILSPFP